MSWKRRNYNAHGDSPSPVEAVTIVTNGRSCLNIMTSTKPAQTAFFLSPLRQCCRAIVTDYVK